MSWSIYIKTDKKMTESDIDKVVAELPDKFKDKCNGAMKGSKQPWGWSLAVDVHLDNSKQIWCSGSCGISGYIAEEFCKYFAKALEKQLECKTAVGKMTI